MGRVGLRRSLGIFTVLLALAALGVCGCAPVCGHRGSGWLQDVAGHPQKGWWSVRFKIQWPEECDGPLWHVDALLADRVVAPVLNRRRSDIVLWRFHRRAARDDAGHQFSFVFFATRKTADRIYDAIRNNRMLKALEASGTIVAVKVDDTRIIAKPDPCDTSDARWPFSIKKSWPYFIMGASEMWLDLISQAARRCSAKDEPSSPESALEYYRRVNERVEELWRQEGGHALLHHLNALFGYAPLKIRNRGLMQF